MLINRRVFFYIGIRTGYIGFRLVVVVVGHEVFNRIIWKELPHFSVKLGRQCFVRRQYDRRPLQFLNDIRNGEGLTGARNAQ